MFRENLLTVTLKKRKTALLLLAAATVYFLFFAFLENPLTTTISEIGKTRLPLLAIYCVLLPLCDIVNVDYMYRSLGLKKQWAKYLFFASNLLVGFVLTTLMPVPGEKITTFSLILHWVTGFGNIFFNATFTLILCLIFCIRKKKKSLWLLFSGALAACIGVLVYFLAMSAIKGGVMQGKNGFYEIVPILMTRLILFALNHTDLVSPRKERDAAEASLKAQDKDVFTAVCCFFLAAAWLSFTFYSLVRNPINYTISMTGLDYPLGFGVTCILISVGLILNFILAFKKSGYKNVLTYILAVGGSLLLIVCVASPTTQSGNGLDLVHSVAAVAFFVLIMVAVFFFCVFKRRENKAYLPLGFGMLFILALTLVTAYVMNILLEQKYGRTGLVEIIPLQYIFFFLFFENFTDKLGAKKQVKSPAEVR